jgi:hypothetical protein
MAPNHGSSEIKGFIGTIRFERSEIDKVPRKTVYDLGLSKDKTFEGKSYVIARL